MKEANLISILSAFNNLSPEIFEAYLKYHSIIMDVDEIKDLDVLVRDLRSLSTKIDVFDKYFIGYTIPQIGKEFDLLRIGIEFVVNIELKKCSTPDKIKTQLVRNRYYLNFLNKEVFNFTYVSDEKKLYKLDVDGNLVYSSILHLLAVLDKQKVKNISDINIYFEASNYLVSPFNSTHLFVEGKYFLTKHQEEMKNTILKNLELPGYSIISIKGKAGTGKTLLTYDIAKVFHEQKHTLIVHCGILNNGHEILRDEYKWNIIPVKYIMSEDLSKFSLIVIDEAQRIYVDQLEHVISEIKRLSNKCIFSYDGQQTLSKKEINTKIEYNIEKEVTIKPFELTTKIRTNKEVATFIKSLFNKSNPQVKLNYSNIDFNYFDNYETAKHFLNQIKTEGWKIINYTPTRSVLSYDHYNINNEVDNAHTVIGQEFDNVVAVIDGNFYYNEDELSSRYYRFEPPYHSAKMLFQIVSRTRTKLRLVIINNPEILTRCLEILN